MRPSPGNAPVPVTPSRLTTRMKCASTWVLNGSPRAALSVFVVSGFCSTVTTSAPAEASMPLSAVISVSRIPFGSGSVRNGIGRGISLDDANVVAQS